MLSKEYQCHFKDILIREFVYTFTVALYIYKVSQLLNHHDCSIGSTVLTFVFNFSVSGLPCMLQLEKAK